MSEEPVEEAEIIDIGDSQMLGICPSGEKIWLHGPVVPGDRVAFTRSGRIGQVTSLLAPAPSRRPCPCPHVDTCPGCGLQPLPYPEQCEWKSRKIHETLRRIGGFREFEWRGLRPSPEEFGTRNKLDLHVDGARVGYTNGRELLPVGTCLLGAPILREVLEALRPALATPHGLHRLMLRCGHDAQQVHVLVRGQPLPETLLSCCREHPAVSALSVQTEPRGPWQCLYGHPTLSHPLCGIDHEIAYDAFFQVHSQQAEALVRTAMDWLREAPVHHLLDLFSGAGAFTLPAAALAQSVLGIDSHPGSGPQFLKADLSAGLPADPRLRAHRWDTVLVDPPRAGMEKKLCRQLRDTVRPRRILYISCNPATLARDLSRLCHESRYRFVRAEGFDLFPQTTHVETLALLEQA